MKYTTAMKISLKYHVLALLPLLLGGAVAIVGIWMGVIDPVLIALDGVSTEALLTGEFLSNAEINPLLGSTSALGGFLIHRIGRTALLLRLHGTAMESRMTTMIEDSQADQPTHRAVGNAPVNPDPAPTSDETEDDTGDAGEGDHDEDEAESDEQEVLDPAEMIEDIKQDLEMDDDADESASD